MSDYARPIGLCQPRFLDYGSGTVARLGPFVAREGHSRILVVADAYNAGRIGLLGLPDGTVVHGTLAGEPDLEDLAAALAVAAELRPDLVIGFGGGSAMDLAKLVAVLWPGEQTIRDIVGPDRVARRPSTIVQIPTTAGTGSEAGIRALVTDPATQAKLAVESRHMLADLAILDPDLTLTVPPAVTAATGVDVLAHCVEAFTSKRAHPLIDGFAREGIRLVGAHLKRCVAHGADAEARAAMLLASYYGGICLGPVNTAAGHALAYPLGTRHGIPHGAANALIFPHVLAFNAPAVPARTAEVLALMGLAPSTDPDEVFVLARDFCAGLGLDMTLAAAGVPRGDLAVMAAEAVAIRRLLDNNPREMTEADILAVYETAYEAVAA
ncbi:iron-containing alcohol dehydrogenase [Methylobrevis pamukkalensis]|uniref:Alcohol dehydrogenase 2 n=1 Tax=Methylobrevis pamukkalensis TaxID=1439726 RepID=A0A1E3H5S1_9HYPH|nr:iron-containing alcohol dehydrogenase [Methylobrevis pamukkalensis]ODN70871.1 Alcohol dehydrogenase 2 [Methylobrevis pamukkalensis]